MSCENKYMKWGLRPKVSSVIARSVAELNFLFRRGAGSSPSAGGLEWSHFRRQLLVVCHGNMCRSPFAAARLAARLPFDDWHVFSAGAHAVENRPVTKQTLRVAAEFGVDLSAHRSRLVDLDQVRYSGLILTMSHLQAETIAQMERGASSRIRLLGAFAPVANLWGRPTDPQQGAAGEEEIPYPVDCFSELHRERFERIALAVNELVDWLMRGAAPAAAPATEDQWLARAVALERRTRPVGAGA